MILVTVEIHKTSCDNSCSTDSDTDFFKIVVGVLQGDTIAPYMFLNLGTSGGVMISKLD